MTGHYQELSPEQVDAARTVLAVLTASDETADDVASLLRDTVQAFPALAVEGFAIVIDALLQLLEGETGIEPRQALDRLGRFLAS